MSIRVYILLLIGFLCTAFGMKAYKDFGQPSHFPAPIYNFERNPISEEKVLLGRVLFYDPILSRDSTISCSSCHSPYNAFAHTDHDLSHGIGEQIGTRNAPALFNLAWQSSFMWDGAANHLDMQALAPIEHPGEMHETIAHVVDKLQRSMRYPGLFEKAFGDRLITGERTLKALSQFQLTLVSAGSRYDSIRSGNAKFTQQEEKGYALYKANCSSCHQEPLFSTYKFANNGLPQDSTLNDWGRGSITQSKSDSLLFKIPSLRNLSYTYPYMHDGRFSKLREVLDHYTDGIVRNPTLSPELQKSIELESNDKVDLLSFLLTLNDRRFVFDPSHQFPRNIFFPPEGKEN